MTNFTELGLHKQVLKAVAAQGYETPTPIQMQAIPPLLEGRDLLGVAQTGTGKTAAFALPTLDLLVSEPAPRTPKAPRVLVLSPTRELASQIAENFRTYSKFMDCVVETVFGGVKISRQIRAMQKGCHVLVATPGRLLDLMNQNALRLDELDVLIMDEADQMFDLGFFNDLKKIMAQVPAERQTLLFSATMPKAVAELAKVYLDDPVKVSITPQATSSERVEQGVLHVAKADKPRMLNELLLSQSDPGRVLVFTRTKGGADGVVRKLGGGGLHAVAIHGNKSQPQRMKALDAFRKGDVKILVATDIAARGIDVDGVNLVVNYELPNVPEQYVHRIGRTARAGREGVAVSLVEHEEIYYLREIEKTIRTDIKVIDAPEGCEELVLPTPDPNMRVRKPKGPARGGRPQSSGRPQGAGRSQNSGRPQRSSRPQRPDRPQREDRAEARSDGRRFEGRPEGRKSEGRSEGRKFEGRSEGRKTEGRRDNWKSEGRSEGAKREGRPEGRKPEGRKPEGKKFETRNEGRGAKPANAAKRKPNQNRKPQKRKFAPA